MKEIKTEKTKFKGSARDGPEFRDRFVTEDDGVSEYIKRKKKAGSNLSDKELKQKIYFDRKIGAEPIKDMKKTDASESVRTVLRRSKGRQHIPKAGKPVEGVVKYHIHEVSDYENRDDNKEPYEQDIRNVSYMPVSNKKRNNRKFDPKPSRKKRESNIADIEIKRQDDKTVLRRRKERISFASEDKKRSLDKKLMNKAVDVIKKNKVLIIAICIIIGALVSVAGVVGTGVEIVSEGFSKTLAGISGAGDLDMTDTNEYFTSLEADLQYKIDHLEELYPGYDVYITDTDDIGHDAFTIMSYLSSVYGGYDLRTVKTELDSLFNDLYEVKFTEKNEGTGKNRKKTLTMSVKKKDLNTVVSSRMNDEQKELFDTYNDSSGGHQVFANPVPGNWSSKISSPFGTRIHPITGKEKFHKGVDIALPTGTPVRSASVGKVLKSYYSDSAGNYIVIEDKSGYQVHYMHLSERNVSVGDTVDTNTIIGAVGSTGNSTGPHLHLGISDSSGNYLNPVFLVQGGG